MILTNVVLALVGTASYASAFKADMPMDIPIMSPSDFDDGAELFKRSTPPQQQKCIKKWVTNDALKANHLCVHHYNTMNKFWCKSGICTEASAEAQNWCWRKHLHDDGVKTPWGVCNEFWHNTPRHRCHGGCKKDDGQCKQECEVLAMMGSWYCNVAQALGLKGTTDAPGLLADMKKDFDTCVKACHSGSILWVPDTKNPHYPYARNMCVLSCQRRFKKITGPRKDNEVFDPCENEHRQTRNACLKLCAKGDGEDPKCRSRCEGTTFMGITGCMAVKQNEQAKAKAAQGKQ